MHSLVADWCRKHELIVPENFQTEYPQLNTQVSSSLDKLPLPRSIGFYSGTYVYTSKQIVNITSVFLKMASIGASKMCFHTPPCVHVQCIDIMVQYRTCVYVRVYFI